MLSASAYSFRLQSRLAISLSWVAGYTNVVTFIVCGGVVVSHTTGNVTHFAELTGDGHWKAGLYFAFLVVAFLAGAVFSALMTETARRRGVTSKYILPIAVQAALLCVMALGTQRHARIDWTATLSSAGPSPDAWTLYWLTGLGSFAMGLQNATITKVSGATVRTTHLTGVVTDLGLEGVQLLLWYRDMTRSRRAQRAERLLRVSRRHPTVLRLLLLASIFGSFLFGAIAGTVAFEYIPRYALLAPVTFLVWIILIDWYKPIADVRELDLTADPELAASGIVKSLLPPGLGIYRLHHHYAGKVHHAPDFQHWADRLPKHWRVVIVAVSPMTHFDVDEAMNLKAAAQTLLTERRWLVVCGLSAAQYRVLSAGGIMDVLGPEDLCPDLEFAIARGIDLIDRESRFARVR
jgi:uncharacterized membrane protein YoaK (UPF0700 family)